MPKLLWYSPKQPEHILSAFFMEKISFLDILIRSWRLSFARFHFFFFGFCMALPLASRFLLPLPNTPLDGKTLIGIVTTYPRTTLSLLTFSLVFTLFGKSQLIPALYRELRPNPSKQRAAHPLFRWQDLQTTLILEGLVSLLFFFVLIILASPSLLSLFLYQSIPDSLIVLGTLAALPILISLFLIREFSLFYALLTPLRLFSAAERGVSLFIQKRSPSLVFSVFSFLISILFTISLNLVMLGSIVLLQRLPLLTSSLPAFFVSLTGFTWYTIFNQALWLTFFVELAAPKDTSPETVPPLKEEVSEIPTI